MAILVGHTEVSRARFNPSIVTQNQSLYLDAGNVRSYDGASSTWFDLSNNKRNATLLNGVSYINQGPSSFFSFDGTNDNVTTTYPITATPALSNWTYEVWTDIYAFPTAVSGLYRKGTLFGAMNKAGAALYWYGSNLGNSCSIFAIIRGNDLYRSTAGFSMQLNKTYQFTLVNQYSSGFFRLYVNGRQFSTAFSPTQQYNATNVTGLNIGISQPQIDVVDPGIASFYTGNVKNVKVYSVALSPQQVSQNFIAFRERYGV